MTNSVQALRKGIPSSKENQNEIQFLFGGYIPNEIPIYFSCLTCNCSTSCPATSENWDSSTILHALHILNDD